MSWARALQLVCLLFVLAVIGVPLLRAALDRPRPMVKRGCPRRPFGHQVLPEPWSGAVAAPRTYYVQKWTADTGRAFRAQSTGASHAVSRC